MSLSISKRLCEIVQMFYFEFRIDWAKRHGRKMCVIMYENPTPKNERKLKEKGFYTKHFEYYEGRIKEFGTKIFW